MLIIRSFATAAAAAGFVCALCFPLCQDIFVRVLLLETCSAHKHVLLCSALRYLMYGVASIETARGQDNELYSWVYSWTCSRHCAWRAKERTAGAG
ncbi:hypothetical protein BDZ88DRAFT_405503 [Geranomyces variabilis]|nr:hypothetical protein BDZ88DRAFT_405503 [Geranomyces variabilis]